MTTNEIADVTHSEHIRTLSERYSSVAEGYLRHWAGTLVAPGLALIDRLELGEASLVLEVAAGTGRLLPHIAAAAPRADLIATDLSEGMIGLAPAEFPRTVADVTLLPFREQLFDAALMAFALFHVLDPLAGLVEIRRVLKPGGKIAVATWDASEDSPAQDLFMAELDRLQVPQLPPRPSSRELLDNQAKLTDILGKAGMEPMATDSWEVTDTMDVEEFLQRSTCLGAHSERYQLLAPEHRPAFLDRVRSLLVDAEPEDLTDRGNALLAWAKKPA